MAVDTTSKPVPNSSYEVARSNLETLDKYLNSEANGIVNRAGKTLTPIPALQESLETLVESTAFVPVEGSFQLGGTIATRNDVLLNTADNSYYSWGGALPKSVLVGSTPATAGGLGVDKWVLRGDSALRSELAAVDSTVLVGGVKAGVLSSNCIDIRSYGAKCDGITNDSAAIQAAIDANRGKVIIFPAGNILLEQTININTSGLGDVSAPHLIGAGMYNTTLINKTGSAAIFIQSGTEAEFAYNLTIANLSIISQGVGTTGLRIEGCRFVTLKNLRIDGMASHGIYGLSTVGDFTDNSSMQLEHVQIENCGGYGVYAASGVAGIQYQWNMSQCRIGHNLMGGILTESMTNLLLSHCAIYYNRGFGLKITKPVSGISPKIIKVDQCEFDTNEGLQIDVEYGENVHIVQPYLIVNTGLPFTATGGIRFKSGSTSCVVEAAYPRLAPSITGFNVMTFDVGCVDVVVRDTIYNGFAAPNGAMYLVNEPSVVIDDRLNRSRFSAGTYTAEIKDTSLTKTSPTSISANYVINNKTVTVYFRNLSNIDLSAFSAGDILGVTLPVPCTAGATSSFVGNCIITTDAASTNAPMPVVSNGGSLAIFARQGTNSYLVSSDLTTGVSDIAEFTLTYVTV